MPEDQVELRLVFDGLKLHRSWISRECAHFPWWTVRLGIIISINDDIQLFYPILADILFLIWTNIGVCRLILFHTQVFWGLAIKRKGFDKRKVVYIVAFKISEGYSTKGIELNIYFLQSKRFLPEQRLAKYHLTWNELYTQLFFGTAQNYFLFWNIAFLLTTWN